MKAPGRGLGGKSKGSHNAMAEAKLLQQKQELNTAEIVFLWW